MSLSGDYIIKQKEPLTARGDEHGMEDTLTSNPILCYIKVRKDDKDYSNALYALPLEPYHEKCPHLLYDLKTWKNEVTDALLEVHTFFDYWNSRGYQICLYAEDTRIAYLMVFAHLMAAAAAAAQHGGDDDAHITQVIEKAYNVQLTWPVCVTHDLLPELKARLKTIKNHMNE